MRRLVLISGAGALVLAGTAGCVVVPADDYDGGDYYRYNNYGYYYSNGGEGGESGWRHSHRHHRHHHNHDDGGERGYDD